MLGTLDILSQKAAKQMTLLQNTLVTSYGTAFGNLFVKEKPDDR
jgi:hypothetical protein